MVINSRLQHVVCTQPQGILHVLHLSQYPANGSKPTYLALMVAYQQKTLTNNPGFLLLLTIATYGEGMHKTFAGLASKHLPDVAGALLNDASCVSHSLVGLDSSEQLGVLDGVRTNLG